MANDKVTNEPTQMDVSSQYPSATRVQEGVAYDVSGKALGKVDDGQADQDPLAALGGVPAQASSGPTPVSSRTPPAQDPLAALGGVPATPPDASDKNQYAAALLAQAERDGVGAAGIKKLRDTLTSQGAQLPPEKGTLRKIWDGVNAGLISKDTLVRAMTGYTPEQINEQLGGPQNGEGPAHAAYREFMRGATQDTAAVGSGFTSPLSVATIGAGEIAPVAGATSRAAAALRAAKNAEGAVTAADAALAARTAEVTRAAQQANEARLAAEAAEAAEKAGQGSKAATVAAQNNASEAAANAMKAQEALKAAEATRAANAVEAAQRARDAAKLQEAAQKAGILGKLPEGVGKVARPIAKTAGVGFTAQGLKEAATGRQEGETSEEEIQRRLMGLGFSLFGAEGFKGSGADVPLTEIPTKIGEGFQKWHEQRALDKAAREKAGSDRSEDAIAAKADYKKAFPPTKVAPYSDEDYEIGRNYLEHHHNNVENINDAVGVRDAYEYERQAIENTVSGMVRKYSREPITTNVKMDVINGLSAVDKVEHGFLDKGMKALEGYDLTDPTMEEADAIRAQLNAKNRGYRERSNSDHATAMRDNPEYAAREYAKESLREGIYGRLEQKKVAGAREMRQDESVLIRLRNNAEKQILNGQKIVRGTSEAGPVKKLAAKGAVVAGAAVGGALGAATGLPLGTEAGAGAGAYAGKKIGDVIAPPDITRDALVQRTFGKKVATGIPTQLVDKGTVGTPQAEPTPPAPSSALSNNETRHIKQELSPLHSELATHYSEGIGDSSYGDLEDRFLSDVAIKREHGVSLETSEKSLLNKINQSKAQHALDARKEAEEAAKEAEKISKEAQQAAKDKADQEKQKEQEEAPFKIGAEIRMPEGFLEPRQLRAHELGHQVVAAALGFEPIDVISHNHPQAEPGAQAEARFDKSSLMTNDRFSDSKINARLGDIITTLYGGPIAQELIHGIPVEDNPSAFGDMGHLMGLLKRYGLSADDIARITTQAKAQAREILAPHAEVIEKYARHRESGLPDTHHVSKQTLGKMIEEINGVTNEPTDNNNKPAAKATGEESKQSDAGTKSKGESSAAAVRGESEASGGGRSGVGGVKVADAANEFNREAGRPDINSEKIAHSPEVAGRIAEAYEAMPHNPSDPAVQKTYDAAKKDIDAQWDYAQDKMGIKFEPWKKDGQPYANSKEMVADVKNNGHLYFFQGGELPADHPMADVDPKTGFSYNDKLRAIHDLFGHAAHEFQFGPKGEESAWNVHRQMFSPEAIPAITTETRGQNSWVNFGKHLRNAEGKVPEKGQPGYVPPPDRPYAQNKAGILPEEFHAPEVSGSEPELERLRRAPRFPEAGLKANAKTEVEPKHGADVLDAMREGVGESTDASKVRQGASFITPEGKFIHLPAGTHHPDAISFYGGEENVGGDTRPSFLEESGAIRVRHSHGRAGETLQVSVPTQGVTPEQAKAIREAVGQGLGRNGNLYIERGDVKPDTKDQLTAMKEFARPSDVDTMLKKIDASPDKKAAPNDSILGEQQLRSKTKASSQEWHEKAAQRASAEPAGGIDPYTSQSATEGIGTEILPEARMPLDHIPTAEDFKRFRDQHEHLFQTHPELQIGWDNTSNVPGGHELNIGAVGPNAHEVARKLGQRAAWDIGKQEELPAGGDGTQTSFPGYTLEQRLADLHKTVDEPVLKANVKTAEPEESFAFGHNTEGTPDQQKGLISTRVPSAQKSTEDPLAQDLKIGREAIDSVPAMAGKMAKLVREYPGMRIPENIKDPDKVLDRFTDHLKNNLVTLFNGVAPERRQANMQWYDSANKLATRLSEKFGKSTKQMAGAIAAMSPQKDWDMNVSLAERVNDIYHTKQDEVATPEMMAKGLQIASRPEAGVFKELVPKLEGKRLGELSGAERAAWVRLYDEAHNPREYQSIDPATGEGRGVVRTAKGDTQRIAWGGLNEIGKAVSILENGSRENISNNLGDAHKVRNFYNNILDPNNPAGHVTIDTHAVAAALTRVLSGKSPEVLHNFGAGGGPKSSVNGVNGTYPLYADAYRAAAKEVGVQPRQLQSVVWEEIRNMFPAEMKRVPTHVSSIADIWQQYADRKLSLDKAHQLVRNYAEQAAEQMAAKAKPRKVSAQEFLEALGQGAMYALGGK